MPKNLADYLREGEIITHTCYGTTYRATYHDGHLIDEIDPGLAFVSPTAFANSHLERGKANGWNKCKVERDGKAVWLKDLAKIEPVVAAAGATEIPATKKIRLRTLDDIKRALVEKTMPKKTVAPAAPPAEKPKKPRAAPATAAPKKSTRPPTSTGGGVGVPPPEPSVICAKVVEGTDGLLDVCSTQLMVLDYFKYDGVLYYKEATTQEVFEICNDKSIGPCIGVWDAESLVLRAPYVATDDNDEGFEYD
jgi:hypothetical protein